MDQIGTPVLLLHGLYCIKFTSASSNFDACHGSQSYGKLMQFAMVHFLITHTSLIVQSVVCLTGDDFPLLCVLHISHTDKCVSQRWHTSKSVDPSLDPWTVKVPFLPLMLHLSHKTGPSSEHVSYYYAYIRNTCCFSTTWARSNPSAQVGLCWHHGAI